MKIYYLLPIIFALILGITACDQVTEPLQTPEAPTLSPGESTPAIAACGESMVVDLLAGQDTTAGTITVENDEENLYVTFETSDGWQLVKSHLAVGDALDAIPTNKAGNPQVGHFPYDATHDPVTAAHTYVIPLEEVQLEPDDVLYVAAHADIIHPEHGEEGAWGDGTQINPQGGSWAMYFEHAVQGCGATSTVIGSEGGTLTVGGATLTVPAGALDSDTEISSQPVDASTLPTGVLPGTAFDFGPDGLEFEQPVELVITYDEADLGGIDEALLEAHLLVGDTWEEVPSSVDTEANTLTTTITHFSVYGILPSLAHVSLNVQPANAVIEDTEVVHSVRLNNISNSDINGLGVVVEVEGLVSEESVPGNCTTAPLSSPSGGVIFSCSVDLTTDVIQTLTMSVRTDTGSEGTAIRSNAEISYQAQSSRTPDVETEVVEPQDVLVEFVPENDDAVVNIATDIELSITNTGSEAVSLENIEANLSGVAMTVELIDGSACTLATHAPDEHQISCDPVTIFSGQSIVLDILRVTPTQTGSLDGTAEIELALPAIDPDETNNESAFSIDVLSSFP